MRAFWGSPELSGSLRSSRTPTGTSGASDLAGGASPAGPPKKRLQRAGGAFGAPEALFGRVRGAVYGGAVALPERPQQLFNPPVPSPQRFPFTSCRGRKSLLPQAPTGPHTEGVSLVGRASGTAGQPKAVELTNWKSKQPK
eukprot:2148399-Alexandrium_andersonii.AAC.1